MLPRQRKLAGAKEWLIEGLSEEDIRGLPEPVQRSLRRSKVIGTNIPSAVTVRQSGRIRTSRASRWLNFTAHETYSVGKPGFLWKASLEIGPITAGRAMDSLEHGHGRIQVKLLGLINVVDASGPELDQGSLLRWLNETMWFPAVWSTDVISWEAVDKNSAVGSITAGALRVSGEFRFDDAGRLVDFYADRYRDVDGAFEMTGWTTPLTGHATFDGVDLPSQGSGIWILDDGEFEYIQIRVDAVSYS